MKRVLGIAAAAAVVALLCWFVYERFIVTDEQRVRRVLSGLEIALEEHDIGAFSGYISPDYRDDWGFDAAGIKHIALAGMRQFETIEIDPLDVKLELDGDTATIVFYPVCKIANDSGRSFDLDREALRGNLLRLTLKKVDRKWRVTRAERQSKPPTPTE